VRTNARTRCRLIAAISARWYRIRRSIVSTIQFSRPAQLEPFDVGDFLIPVAEDFDMSAHEPTHVV